MLFFSLFFFFNDTATTDIYTLSLHDALPISTPLRMDDLSPRLFRRNALPSMKQRRVVKVSPHPGPPREAACRAPGSPGGKQGRYGCIRYFCTHLSVCMRGVRVRRRDCGDY